MPSTAPAVESNATPEGSALLTTCHEQGEEPPLHVSAARAMLIQEAVGQARGGDVQRPLSGRHTIVP
jgi:hypothetical protein